MDSNGWSVRATISPDRRDVRATLGRRTLLGAIAAALAGIAVPLRAAETVSFGLTPVFLDSDIKLLSMLQSYLEQRLERPVTLVKRRTYQEITAMLLSGQLDAAWVCNDPYVQHEDKLALLAVPLYHRKPLYQTYVVVNEASRAQSFDDIRGTVHAFSDPDSTSGYLVTRWLLALRRTTPAEFFRNSFFTYGHRNVIRAVSTGLAESGSIDGYVWDVMGDREPELVGKTRIIYRSEWLGFPPVVGLQATQNTPMATAIAAALIDMTSFPLGRDIYRYSGSTASRPKAPSSMKAQWRCGAS